MNRKAKYYTIFAIMSLAFIASAFMLCLELTQRKQAQEDFEMLAEYANTAEKNEHSQAPDTTTDTERDKAAPKPKPKRNIAGLSERNPDCVGWIFIPDTAVDYPVMHTPNEPEKYLRSNFDGAYSGAGIPFLDYGCSLECDNLIIYGHNMLNGTMFADLIKYLNEDFRQNHLSIEFETVEGCYYYTVTDVRMVHKTDKWYDNLYTEDGNKYLTLSTCYGSDNDGRLIVIAVRDDIVEEAE